MIDSFEQKKLTGMNGGHEAFDNAELVMDHLGERSQTVGGTGRIG
jgi:3-hydroxyisobutyrate dehydrogenase-like beta-hydroxyacid dehydrogenase